MMRRPARQCRGEAMDAAAAPGPHHRVRMHLHLMCLCCAGVGRVLGLKAVAFGLVSSSSRPIDEERGWMGGGERGFQPSITPGLLPPRVLR